MNSPSVVRHWNLTSTLVSLKACLSTKELKRVNKADTITDWKGCHQIQHRPSPLQGGNNDIKYIVRYTESLQNFPEGFHVHRVEGLCKHHVQFLILFSSFLSNLTKGKYHVNGASARAKATLGFLINIMMLDYSVGNKACQYFTCNGQR